MPPATTASSQPSSVPALLPAGSLTTLPSTSSQNASPHTVAEVVQNVDPLLVSITEEIETKNSDFTCSTVGDVLKKYNHPMTSLIASNLLDLPMSSVRNQYSHGRPTTSNLQHEDQEAKLPAIELVMSDSEITSWMEYFEPRYNAVLCQHIVSEINVEAERNNAFRYTKSLAKIARAKDDVVKYTSLHGECYQWCAQFNYQFPKDSLPSDGSAVLMGDSFFEDGGSYVLHLKTNKGKWEKYVEVKKSEFINAGLGVFACRHFYKGQMLGWYGGRVLYKSDVQGGDFLSDDHLLAQNVPDSPYSLSYRDNNCYFTVTDPLPFKVTSGSPGFMGLHLLNNYGQVFQKGTPSYEANKSRGTCKIREDGAILVKNRIHPGQEILCPYDEDEIVFLQERKKGKATPGQQNKDEDEDENDGDKAEISHRLTSRKGMRKIDHSRSGRLKRNSRKRAKEVTSEEEDESDEADSSDDEPLLPIRKSRKRSC